MVPICSPMSGKLTCVTYTEEISGRYRNKNDWRKESVTVPLELLHRGFNQACKANITQGRHGS